MMRSGLLFAAGGDVLTKYGTLTRRYQVATRGGEDTVETLTRAGAGAGALGPTGLLVPYAANVPRIEYQIDPVTGLLQAYLLLEAAATNVVLRNRDFTNAAWTKVNCTPLRNQLGLDGLINGASQLTATGANATCLQAITLASSARFQTAYVKRVTGSGTIQMTTDNGASWISIVVTGPVAGPFVRVSIPTQTLANPTVGFRIVTSGDSIIVDFVQNETGAFASNPIETAGAAVTRNADAMTAPYFVRPQVGLWMYERLLDRGAAIFAGYPLLATLGNNVTPSFRFIGTNPNTANTYGAAFWNTDNDESDMVGGAYGNVIELFQVIMPDTTTRKQIAINGTPGALLNNATTQPIPAAWGGAGIVSLAGPAAVSRVMHGLDGGVSIKTLLDARAVPI